MRVNTLSLAMLAMITTTIIGGFTANGQVGGSGTAGQGAIWQNSTTLTGSPGVLYADQYSGADACAKINAALLALPSTGGTVDARNFQGNQPCASNIYATLPNKANRLLLGGATFQMSVPWVMPVRSRIEGINGGNLTKGTLLQATASFPTNSALLVMGNTTTAVMGVTLQDLAIDCNSTSGSIGIQNLWAEEESTVDRITIYNCLDTGLEVRTSGAQNGGPYRDLYVIPGSSQLSTTTCARIGVPAPGGTMSAGDNPYGWRGIIGMTCNGGNGSTAMNAAILISGQGGILSGIHLERMTTGIVIGSNTAATTNGLILENINACAATWCATPVQMSNLVEISNASTNVSQLDVSISGVQVTGTGNSIKDDIQNITVTDSSVARYDLGRANSNGQRALLTTATGISGGKVALLSQGGSAPSGACATGSIFQNRAGGTGTTEYVCEAGAWKAK